MFALGYAQAQDRLWQMDIYRRLASGTLAEVMGESVLEIDRLTRRIGFRRAAERDWQQGSDQERDLLQAFSAGINAYLTPYPLPLEFTALRYRPQPWQPQDSIAFSKFMAWTVNGNWDKEILRSWTIERFGAEVLAEIEPGYPLGMPLIVPPPTLKAEFAKVAELIVATGQALSNSWAVDGVKSMTGKPLLANDPHLPLQMPSIWYEVHLHCQELKVAGACLPGTPAILIGHNERIAWGITAAMVDGDDLFVERLNPDNPRQYEFQGRWLDAQVGREEFRVRGRRRAVVEETMITCHGPVISPCIDGAARTLAMRTTALEAPIQVDGALRLMRAHNWEEFREALRTWITPPQSFLYADVDGNIGYQLAGLIPLRGKGYGLVPSPGWTGEYDWTGFVPFNELPWAYNPETHWLATANNKIADDDYPHFLACNYDSGYRQRRIVERLQGQEKLSLADFKALQGDVYSIPGRALASMILALQPADPWCRRAQVFVNVWDYQVTADSVAACIVEVFLSHLVRRALQEKLGSWSEFFLGRGIHPISPLGHFFFNAPAWLLEKIERRPDWFGDKTWQEAMDSALEDTVTELRRLLGDDMSRWRWGRLHTQSFRHLLGQAPPLARIFNRGPVPIGGDCTTVSQAAYTPRQGYQLVGWTASFRVIADLGDFNNSLAVMPTGQSGHPGSRHYADMTELWQRGEYHPMPWDRADVEAVARARLLLEPVDGAGES
jgi:penicillin amidase